MNDDNLLHQIVATVVTAAGRPASVSFYEPPGWVGSAGVFIRPQNPDAPVVSLTDTTVSLYLEFLGAHWEADSLEDVSFEERFDWAVSNISCAADFGFVRVRRRGQWWGRQTHLLTSHDDFQKWSDDPRLVVARSWPSWT